MRTFRDNETNEVLTLEDLKAEYTNLYYNGETEAETFKDYLINCTSKNGTLTEI